MSSSIPFLLSNIYSKDLHSQIILFAFIPQVFSINYSKVHGINKNLIKLIFEAALYQKSNIKFPFRLLLYFIENVVPIIHSFLFMSIITYRFQHAGIKEVHRQPVGI